MLSALLKTSGFLILSLIYGKKAQKKLKETGPVIPLILSGCTCFWFICLILLISFDFSADSIPGIIICILYPAALIVWALIVRKMDKPTLPASITPPESEASEQSKDISLAQQTMQCTPSAPHKYCSKCGSAVDPISKKCSGCGKQYFKLPRNFLVVMVIVCLVLSTLSMLAWNVILNMQYRELTARYEDLIIQHKDNVNSLSKNYQSSIDALESESLELNISLWELTKQNHSLSADYEAIKSHLYAFVINDDSLTYHSLNGCEWANYSEELVELNGTEASRTIRRVNTLENDGYIPCQHCLSNI